MSQPVQKPETDSRGTAAAAPAPSLINCLVGAAIAGGISVALYGLTVAIATNLAAHPIHAKTATALSIASAVRTLVIGMSALGTGIFGLTALGLIAFTVQQLFRRGQQPTH